jgi:hypothetical protein
MPLLRTKRGLVRTNEALLQTTRGLLQTNEALAQSATSQYDFVSRLDRHGDHSWNGR